MRIEVSRECYVCDYCGNVFAPEPDTTGVRVFDQPAGCDCPVCRKPLLRGVAAQESICCCPNCGGMLIQMDAFTGIVTQLRSAFTSRQIAPSIQVRDLERRIPCPLCHAPMDAHPYGGPGNIVIDSCENCCVDWLDNGELQRIVHAPDHSYTN